MTKATQSPLKKAAIGGVLPEIATVPVKFPLAISRRASLALALGGLVPSGLVGRAVAAGADPDSPDTASPDTASPAAASPPAEAHGLSVFGDLALAPDFAHLPYADPAAPKGGQIVSTVGTQTTFDTLNAFILKGVPAGGMDLIFDSLMTSSADEPDAAYGLVAKSVAVSPDKTTYRFHLRREARFHDGSPLTAHDVAFSLDILKAKGHPAIRASLRDVISVTAEADDVVTVAFAPTRSREAPLFLARLPIFSAAYYAKQPFDQSTLKPPLGSAAYKVGSVTQGRTVVFTRVPDYWARDLPINRGIGNFDAIRYEYFADTNVGFEAFKAGVYTFREEFKAAFWATGYGFPAAVEGRVKREAIPDKTPQGRQGWYINTRRAKFKDPRIRRALGYAFDFKWANANLMFGAYARTVSYFPNSMMAATGMPGPEELAVLEPFRAELSPDVFGPVYLPPESDGSGADRALLKQAFALLEAAGCKRLGSRLALPDGSPLTIEFLSDLAAFEPHTGAFIRNLRLLGIDASFRLVDESQYKRRKDDFDFDVIVENFSVGFTPGENLRDTFGSEAAKTPGSNNVCGIADPVVDALIAKALVADSRETLTVLCKAIDRVLRAGHYWVPMWNITARRVAYWNLFSRPARNPQYGLSAISTWWYDPEKAEKTDLAHH